MARMEREMEALQRDFKGIESSYGETVLNLMVASGSLGSSSLMREYAATSNGTTPRS